MEKKRKKRKMIAMTKTFKQRLKQFRAYIYYYYIDNVKPSIAWGLDLAYIIIVVGVLSLILFNQLALSSDNYKSYAWDSTVINESTFQKYYCFNNVTFHYNLLNNKLEIVPNETNDVCKEKSIK